MGTLETFIPIPTWRIKTISLNTSLQLGSGLSGRLKGGKELASLPPSSRDLVLNAADNSTAGASAGVKAVGWFLLYFLDSSVLKMRVFTWPPFQRGLYWKCVRSHFGAYLYLNLHLLFRLKLDFLEHPEMHTLVTCVHTSAFRSRWMSWWCTFGSVERRFLRSSILRQNQT